MLIKTISLIKLISNTDKNHKSDKIQNKSCYNYTVYCTLLLLTILSFAVQSFKGSDIPRLFKPIAQSILGGSSSFPPCFLEEHVVMLWLLILVFCFSYLSFLIQGTKPPLYRWHVSLFQWVRTICIREVDRHCPSS